MIDSSLIDAIYYSYLAVYVVSAIFVVSASIFTVFAILSYGTYNEESYRSRFKKILLSASVIVVIIVCVLGFTCKTNSSNLANEIKESYNVTVDSSRLIKSICNIEDGVSPVMHARLDDDDRVYDVYLVEDNAGDSYNLCTRSEKGVYLKITGSSKELLK